MKDALKDKKACDAADEKIKADKVKPTDAPVASNE